MDEQQVLRKHNCKTQTNIIVMLIGESVIAMREIQEDEINKDIILNVNSFYYKLIGRP